MMKTPAWQSLAIGPRQLLVELYNLYNGSNNGQLFLSVRDAAKRLHVTPNTVSPWFGVLIETGFIKVAQRGTFSLKSRHATSWTLTEFPLGDDLPTKEFARWRSTDEIQKPVSKSETDGIKNCDRGPDPSTLKSAPRWQKLIPSKQISAANGIKHCDTGKLPGRADSSNRPEVEEDHAKAALLTSEQRRASLAPASKEIAAAVIAPFQSQVAAR
jgi:hypothetical protein